MAAQAVQTMKGDEGICCPLNQSGAFKCQESSGAGDGIRVGKTKGGPGGGEGLLPVQGRAWGAGSVGGRRHGPRWGGEGRESYRQPRAGGSGKLCCKAG